MRKYSRIVFALIVLIKSNTSGQLVEQYPPADYSNPIEPECEDLVSHEDCTRLLVANLYKCDDFNEEQRRLCQATCNLCGTFDQPEEPKSEPPAPAIDITKATSDDFVELENPFNVVDEDGGVLPNHGQVPGPTNHPPPQQQPVMPMMPGHMMPGYPMNPYGHMPYYPGMGAMAPGMQPMYPAGAHPAAKGKRPTANAPPWAMPPGSDGDDDGAKDSGPKNPDGAIRGGAANVNVPVLGSSTVPGMLLPLWAVILICFGIIVMLICCCWLSVKVHGCWLRRKHSQAQRAMQKDTDVRVAQLKTELAAMKKIANEKVQNIEETKEIGESCPEASDEEKNSQK